MKRDYFSLNILRKNWNIQKAINHTVNPPHTHYLDSSIVNICLYCFITCRWERTLTTSILTSNFLIKFFAANLFTQAKTPQAKVSHDANQNSFLKQQGLPARPCVTDPKTMIHLTFTAHLHIVTKPCPTFSLYEPRSIFSTLETIFGEMLVCCCLPSVGLTEINPFLLSPPLVSAFGLCQ